MKLSGAVGTYSNIPPEVEQYVGDRLGLTPVAATQVVARDRHAEFLYACASIGATCELMAVELRHLQRTEVREVQEGFKPGQKGFVGDAAQAQPDLGRDDLGPRPSAALEPCWPASKTWRCGTNATSPTARSSEWCFPTRRSSRTT